MLVHGDLSRKRGQKYGAILVGDNHRKPEFSWIQATATDELLGSELMLSTDTTFPSDYSWIIYPTLQESLHQEESLSAPVTDDQVYG